MRYCSHVASPLTHSFPAVLPLDLSSFISYKYYIRANEFLDVVPLCP